MLDSDAVTERRSLAEMILARLEERKHEAELGTAPSLDPTVVSVYSQVGVLLSHYTSGKVPKSFKIIAQLQNWEEVLQLTNPGRWSPHAFFIATKMFAHAAHEKIAQRFYINYLLPKIRDDILEHKRLNFHLFNSLKKAVYKPMAFVLGILLPLLQEDCTLREAVIVCAVLTRISIPVVHAGVFLIKLAQLQLGGTTTLFMKTLLQKKYALHRSVISTICDYFIHFKSEQLNPPVIWHSTLLTFVQRYKKSLSRKQKSEFRSLLKVHSHQLITPEIRRELASDESEPAKHTKEALEKTIMTDVFSF